MRNPTANPMQSSRVAAATTAATAAGARLRVMRIIDRLNVGGPARHVVWLTEGLSEREFETTLITGTVPHGEGDMSYFAHESGVEPVVLKEMSRELSPGDVAVIARLFLHMWRAKPDVVHTHKAKAGAVGRVAATLYKWLTPSALWLQPRRCHVVHTYHGHIFHSYYGAAKTRLFVTIERLLARLCTDRIVVISEQQRREICETFGVGRPEQFRVIALGTNFHEEGPTTVSLRDELAASADEPVVGIVGRLCEVKNHSLFLEAAAHLAGEPSGLAGLAAGPRFAVIGDGHLRWALERQARELGIGDRTVFTGFRKDVAPLYRDLDIVALTSLNEGTPLTLIEAMSQGRAVAATEVGGVVDILGARRETIDGFVVWDHGVSAPSGNSRAFARALQYLLERPDLRRDMGERGRAFVRTHLSKDRLLADIGRLYQELAGIRAQTACPGEAEPVTQTN